MMEATHTGRSRLLKTLLILLLAGALLFLGLVGMLCWKERHVEPMADYNAIIVLGCQVKPGGTPSLQLTWRLDAAYDAWQASPCMIVVTGGQGKDEPAPEGRVMRDYLLRLGVPAEQILCDESSVNTRENLRFARDLLGSEKEWRVLVVSSDYHLPRAIAMAQDEGLVASGIASRTLGGFYWVKNHAREALAWLKYWVEKYAHITL